MSGTTPKNDATRSARHLVLKMQHCGPHEQDRHDARNWMDDHGAGRCRCRKCVTDEKRFQARARAHETCSTPGTSES